MQAPITLKKEKKKKAQEKVNSCGKKNFKCQNLKYNNVSLSALSLSYFTARCSTLVTYLTCTSTEQPPKAFFTVFFLRQTIMSGPEQPLCHDQLRNNFKAI